MGKLDWQLLKTLSSSQSLPEVIGAGFKFHAVHAVVVSSGFIRGSERCFKQLGVQVRGHTHGINRVFHVAFRDQQMLDVLRHQPVVSDIGFDVFADEGHRGRRDVRAEQAFRILLAKMRRQVFQVKDEPQIADRIQILDQVKRKADSNHAVSIAVSFELFIVLSSYWSALVPSAIYKSRAASSFLSVRGAQQRRRRRLRT